MKKIIYILAMAAIAAVSCQKFEKEAPAVNEAPAFTRTLYACFDGEVKTTLGDDYTPAWAVGDDIYLYAAGQDLQTFTIKPGDIVGGKVRIETSLTGDIYAIYGAEATLNGNTLTFDITGKQGAEFKDAHVCVAKDVNGALSFKNATSIIRIKKDNTGIHYVNISDTDNKAQGEINAEFDNGGNITISPNSYTSDITLGTKRASNDKVNKSDLENCISSNFYYFSVIPGEGYSVTLERYVLNKDTGGKVNKINKHSIANKTVGENKIITITPNLQ